MVAATIGHHVDDQMCSTSIAMAMLEFVFASPIGGLFSHLQSVVCLCISNQWFVFASPIGGLFSHPQSVIGYRISNLFSMIGRVGGGGRLRRGLVIKRKFQTIIYISLWKMHGKR